jgi:16S rRNA C967 or C1407 C5-methylase (RsmB/RsmF family)/NOL1/NOP2/fmu family ribosome biogenesis protein
MQSLPVKFIDRINRENPNHEILLSSLNSESPISIRLNPNKKQELNHLEFAEQVPWCSTGYYLKSRPKFTLDPLFHAGCYYPQEAGSMYIESVFKSLDLSDSPAVLDLCAAPGGKSTLLAGLLNNQGVLVSNEVIRSRAYILAENVTKSGYSNCLVSNNDPKDFSTLKGSFDVILIDAPCSGEGMFRKDLKSRAEWSEENANMCSSRQKRIVMDVWESLKENGYLIYSTCTFNPEENENNIDWLLNELDCEIVQVPLFENVITDSKNYGVYFLPGFTKSEGFYCCVLQKKEKVNLNSKIKLENLSILKSIDNISSFTKNSSNSVFWNENETIFGTTELAFNFYRQHLKKFKWMKVGVKIGENSRKGFTPDIELALNPNLINDDNSIELTKKQALKFLHGDTFELEATFGIHLVSYQNQPLGFIKHLGNRFNNLYPKEWRIRMDLGF